MATSTTTTNSHSDSKLDKFPIAFEYNNTWHEAKLTAQKISK